MIRYIVKRALLIIPAVLVILFILFTLTYSLPASRISMMPVHHGGDALDAFFTAIKAPDNFLTKFIRYIFNIVAYQDFGRSTATNIGLMSSMSYRIRNTLFLLLSGVGVTMIIGIPTGIYAALHKERAGDRFVRVISLFLSAIPPIFDCHDTSACILCFLRLLPLIPSYTEPVAYILPAVTIALGGIASVARMARSSMLEVLEQPYITALRSKGLAERSVVLKHALKNALLPIISTLGGYIAQLLCGTLVVENFFNVPGLGSFMLDSVGSRDHFGILGCAVILIFVLMCLNLASDILYAFVNPKIRLRYAGRSAGIARVRNRKEAAE